MDWSEVLYIVVTAAIGLVSTVATIWIKQKMGIAQSNAKTEQGQKFLSILESTINNCILTTNQVYVANLKKDNLFDAEAQKKAFDMTYNSVMNILGSDIKKHLSESYNDVPALIKQMIEAQINKSK